jgi:hypothetical protein
MYAILHTANLLTIQHIAVFFTFLRGSQQTANTHVCHGAQSWKHETYQVLRWFIFFGATVYVRFF